MEVLLILKGQWRLTEAFGGHIVSGHIDGIGKVAAITRDDNAIWYQIKTDIGILKYIVEKGSVAIDGISLTVAKTDSQSFQYQ